MKPPAIVIAAALDGVCEMGFMPAMVEIKYSHITVIRKIGAALIGALVGLVFGWLIMALDYWDYGIPRRRWNEDEDEEPDIY